MLGVLRPQIVVPAWLMTACAGRQTLVMAHEQAHIDAADQRVRQMTRRPARWHRVAAPLLLLLSLDTGAAAALVTPPQGSVAGAAVSVPQPLRQSLAGYYQLGANRIAVISVTADGLAMKTNVEPSWRLIAESDDRYVIPGSDLRVRFDRVAATLTLSQFGANADPAPRVNDAAVERADAYVAARVASQQPLAGGEAIVRRNVGARAAGQLHAPDFTPGFLRQARALMPRQRKLNENYGNVEDVTFDGVNRWGWDRYKVRYAKHTATWAIWLDANGKLVAATPNDPPL